MLPAWAAGPRVGSHQCPGGSQCCGTADGRVTAGPVGVWAGPGTGLCLLSLPTEHSCQPLRRVRRGLFRFLLLLPLPRSHAWCRLLCHAQLPGSLPPSTVLHPRRACCRLHLTLHQVRGPRPHPEAEGEEEKPPSATSDLDLGPPRRACPSPRSPASVALSGRALCACEACSG